VNRKDAAFRARGIVDGLIESYFSAGQSFDEASEQSTPQTDAQKIFDELLKIQKRFRK